MANAIEATVKNIENMLLACLKYTSVTDELLVSASRKAYIENRVEYLLSVWAKFSFIPTTVTLYLHPELLDELRGFDSLGSVKIKLRYDKKIVLFDPATFKIQAGNKDISIEATMLGLCFDRKVSRKYFETRWTLQAVDGVNPHTADKLADKLLD